jgi:hypothetical protein
MARRKTKRVKRKSKPKRTAKPKRPALPRGILTVAEAAEVMWMTPGGVYSAIRRGDVPAKRIDGLWTIARVDAKKHLKDKIEWFKRTDPNRPLTEQEFLQRLWDSDPDD